MRRSHQTMIAIFVPLVLLLAIVIGRSFNDDTTGDLGTIDLSSASEETNFEHDYIIPAGTAARIAAGETVDVVPERLTVRVGEAIRIVNHDDRGHQVGVFYVGAGESLTQRFNSTGTLSEDCDVHASGAFTLIVIPVA